MYCRDSVGSAIHPDRQVNLEPQIHEIYINLMCLHRPGDVYNYIKVNEGYRLEETLEVNILLNIL